MGSSLLVAGLLSVSIPIIIHLLHRQKTKPLLWGAMMFLKESPLQMKRRKMVEHWLLLLLRMAALAFLAWMLARPLFDAAKISPLGNQAVDVAVVVDHSMSMGRHHGEKTLHDEAIDVVDKLTTPGAGVLRAGDTISVILAEHNAHKFTPIPLRAGDPAAMNDLHAGLHKLKPGLTDCTIPVAVEAAREVVNRGPNMRKVVLVVSDEQKSNWSIGDNAAWTRAVGDDQDARRHFEVHSYPLVADDSSSNISIGDISVQPSLVGINRPVQLTTSISNSGPKDAAQVNVHFSVNGQEVGAPQVIPMLSAKTSITVRFDHTFTTPGSTWVRVWTDVVDSLAADNEAVAAIHVWEKLPILIIDGQLTTSDFYKGSMFLASAMQPVDPDQKDAVSLVQPKVISVSDSSSVNLDDYYAVVLNDVPQLPADVQNKLTGYVSSGHGLWIILGQHTTHQMIASLGNPTLESRQVLFTAEAKSGSFTKAPTPATVEIRDPNNLMVAILTAGERNPLAGALVKDYWSLVAKDADAQVVVASSTGEPLVIDRPLGSGRIAIWATSVDGNWNNWHIMPNFVPLVNETLNQLCAAQTREHRATRIEAGGEIAWRGPANPPVDAVDVKLPDGTEDKGRKVSYRDGHREFTYLNAFLPGLYQLTFPTQTAIPQPVYYGVSIDRRELDNTALADEDQTWLINDSFLDAKNPRIKPDKLGFLITRSSSGSDIWVYLAGFVVLSLMLETYMTYRMVSLQKGVDVANAGLLPKA